jgi:hypothetical protein
VVRTNQGRYAKVLLQTARQKIDGDRAVPIVLIDRFVTYKEGTEQTVQATGKNVYLFAGFRWSLDLGQVVPADVPADVQCIGEGNKVWLEPLGDAKLFLVTKANPDAVPKKGPKLVVGPQFEPRYFAGTYKLFDDGRRSGKLVLQVDDAGEVTGSYYSDRDGEKYEVRGKVGMALHAIQFTIKFPRSEQTFQGWLFTGDARAMTGSSRLLDRQAGFYAERVEE